MFSFVHRFASPSACLGPVHGALEGHASGLDPSLFASHDPSIWLQARMLWLICALASAFGCLYSGYFISVGLVLAAPVGLVCLIVSAVSLRFARATGHYDRALDIVSTLLFTMLALITLFQDGIHSPALWWLGVPMVAVLLAGRMMLGLLLCVLFAAQVLLLYLHGPGSVGPFSLLAANRTFQLLLSMTLSALFVSLCAALSSHWGTQLRQALEKARAAAVAMSAAKARFVSHVSHEIRTPLQGLIGATEMLREPALASERRLLLADVQRQSAGMLMTLVNEVLDFSKLEAGKVVLESRPLSLSALVEELVAYFSPQACEKGLDLVCTCSPDVPELVLGDDTRLRQIVGNLVSNAIKFTSKGSVHVHLGLEGRAARDASGAEGEMRVRIQIADSGVGIDAARLPSLFKPFEQADESITRRFGGTGLGLSIADELAHLMDSHIEVSSAVGRGSTFTLVMPLRLPEADASLPTSSRNIPSSTAAAAAVMSAVAAAEPGADGRSLAGLVVIVADDDPASQVVVAAMIEALQATVIAVSDGHEALAAMEANDVDLVLMDVNMPGFDGLRAIRSWREREHADGRRALPVIAMTGSTEPGELAACVGAGMSMILTKPFQLAELRRTLIEAANRPPAMRMH